MALSKAIFASIVISLFLIQFLHAYESVNTLGNNQIGKNIDCGSECNRRCGMSSRQHLCLRACGTCCARCGCVPPGTSGHEDVCPCYARMTTHHGRRKCP
ncbi:cypmaclein-like [Amaranthus tricolor]|uniref:cypmaclein-like n=1 Tax=Amaranthus tricolor TaxID=29722 RepID=UPI00258DF975|nr:cypmaclein-like [Amaranthus tricolor]